MNPRKTTSTNWPLVLIAIALVGAGISYHFTLESRFAAIEQKLDQDATALQQYQASQESMVSSKAETLDSLTKKVDALQSSLDPLTKAAHDQNDALADLRKQIATLQQAEEAQDDAQKKLSDYSAQLEKIRHDAQVHSAQAPAPPAHPSTPTVPAPSAPHVSSANVSLPFPPRADSAVDLRAAQSAMPDDGSVRALPVALPVSLSASNER